MIDCLINDLECTDNCLRDKSKFVPFRYKHIQKEGIVKEYIKKKTENKN